MIYRPNRERSGREPPEKRGGKESVCLGTISDVLEADGRTDGRRRSDRPASAEGDPERFGKEFLHAGLATYICIYFHAELFC